MMVRRPAGQLEQARQQLGLDGLEAEGLVGTPGSDRVLELHVPLSLDGKWAVSAHPIASAPRFRQTGVEVSRMAGASADAEKPSPKVPTRFAHEQAGQSCYRAFDAHKSKGAKDMRSRVLGSQGLEVSTEGLGCMGMSEFYGRSDENEPIAASRSSWRPSSATSAARTAAGLGSTASPSTCAPPAKRPCSVWASSTSTSTTSTASTRPSRSRTRWERCPSLSRRARCA